MVTTTGRISPSWLFVCALKPLQNSMMLTPCWPSAGPTGGEGLAFPAGICSFTIAWTFFAMAFPLERADLAVRQLQPRVTSEHRDEDLQPSLGRRRLGDPALESALAPPEDPPLARTPHRPATPRSCSPPTLLL